MVRRMNRWTWFLLSPDCCAIISSDRNRKRREFREKAEDNPQKALYITRCDSIRSKVRRKKIDPQIAETAKLLAKNKLNRAVWDNDYALNHYETEMELDALIAEAMEA